jgi:hypothetical protein
MLALRQQVVGAVATAKEKICACRGKAGSELIRDQPVCERIAARILLTATTEVNRKSEGGDEAPGKQVTTGG